MEVDAVLIDIENMVYGIDTSQTCPVVKWNGVIQDSRVDTWSPSVDYEGKYLNATLTFQTKRVTTGIVTVCYNDAE
jgi:hypothetical protein